MATPSADRCFPPYLYTPCSRNSHLRFEVLSLICPGSRLGVVKHGGLLAECRSDARSGSHLLLVRCSETRRLGPRVHDHQQVRDDGLASDNPGRQLRRRRVRAQVGPVRRLHCSPGVVGPHLGPHRLRLRRVRHGQVRHRLLRPGTQVRWRVGRPAGEPGRVHARLARLLRRVPRRRIQPAHHGDAHERPGQLLHGRVRRRPPGDLPGRALRQGRRREDGGVPERLRRLQHRPVLLPRQVRRPLHLPAHAILQEVQGGLPDGLQLRLRRPQQPLPVLRRRLHHHLLLKQEAIGVLVPQQQTRLQWLQQTPAGHVCSPAALWLRGAAVFAVIEVD